MKVTILGTGTSMGVPIIGCRCPVCTSTDPRDNRLRCSALIETEQCRVLIDCGPDFRQQMLRIGFEGYIDACLITHEHYDHVGGLDDLRPMSYMHEVHLYADDYTATNLEEKMPYCLQQSEYKGRPRLQMHRIEPHQHLQIADLDITVLQVMHGRLPILAYRIGDFAYITDAKTIPETEIPLLRGVKTLIINGLRHEPHETHQTIQDAVTFAQRLGVQDAYITHLCDRAGLHAVEDAKLPEGIHLAYDNLVLEV